MNSERVAHIKVELTKEGTRTSKIFTRSVISIGRAANSDLQIDDPSMSRDHLKIELKDKKIYVTDLGSSNGSLLNQSRLTANKATLVSDGAVIRPGSAKIKLIVTLIEVRQLDDVDAELEHITMALQDLAKVGVNKVQEIKSHEETLEKSVRSKQEKLIQLVDKLESQSLKKEEIEAVLKSAEPKLARVTALLKQQEPRVRKFWDLRKKQLRLFRQRREILLELGDRIDELEINIENHGLLEKRNRFKEEIARLTDTLETLRRTEEKTRSDVESQLRLLEVKKQTEQAELQLLRARLQKEIEEVEGKKTAATSQLFELQRELSGISKQLADVRDNLASEISATEKLEGKKAALEVTIEELQGARDALARSINSLSEEEENLSEAVKTKHAEVKKLEDFIMNRLAETDERCREIVKESKEEMDRELAETSTAAREHLEAELKNRRESVLSELGKREDDLNQRINGLEAALQEQNMAFEERMNEEEKRRKKSLELSLQEMQLQHERTLQDKEADSITRQTKVLEKQLRGLASSALTTAALHIKSTTPNAATLLASPELEEEVFTALKTAIAPHRGSKDHKPVIARAADLSDRERRFWLRMGSATVATIMIIVTLVINPNWPGQFLNSAYSYIKNQETGSDYFVRKLEEERANRPKFLPEQTRVYKESYTDNLLYSEGFLLIKTDETVKKNWTLKLNQFLIKEFEVDEDVVVRFLPVESRLINDLADLMKNISPNFIDDGVQKMRQVEQSYRIEIESILGGPENYKKFWAFQGQFYADTLASLGSRVPAGAKK